MEPSSPPGPEFDDEREMLLGNDDNVEDEGEGEELFGDNFERCILKPPSLRTKTW